jgi:hypothetical protein
MRPRLERHQAIGPRYAAADRRRPQEGIFKSGGGAFGKDRLMPAEIEIVSIHCVRALPGAGQPSSLSDAGMLPGLDSVEARARAILLFAA